MSIDQDIHRESRQPNRLANETSTYLLQHAYNPVDWFPWGAEALAKAKEEDKPILLSIGYSACHWCHVMEHESFEDKEVAALMNELFINIKVDREERPDLDEIYMKAVQMLTGHGGWPMTVFLTPELRPFYGGTYFPPEDRHGMPSFRRLLVSVHRAWTEMREDVEASSRSITEHLSRYDALSVESAPFDASVLNLAAGILIKVFDRQYGGFGGAPKFPHTASLEFILRRLVGDLDEDLRFDCNQLVRTTLNHMAYGGIHDQIGGGFARYSVDRKWLIPHFEKMLYDNALLAKNYFDAFRLTGRHYWLRVAEDILTFVDRELSMPEGGFYCSLDADSEGEEGKYYVFRPEEILACLGEKDGAWFNATFDITEAGNFEHGTNNPHLADDPDELAMRQEISTEQFWQKVDSTRAKLFAYRSGRVKPGRDEKMLTSWTSLMISGFIAGFQATGKSEYRERAIKAAKFIIENLLSEGRLLRTYGKGMAKLNAYLDDYAYFIQALLDVASVDANPLWLQTALKLNDVVLVHFKDEDQAVFFYTSDDHERLLIRNKHVFDGSTPSATSVVVSNLLRLATITGQQEWRTLAEAVIKSFVPFFGKAPDQFSNMLCAADFALSSPAEVVIVGNRNSRDLDAHIRNVFAQYRPNAVVVCMTDENSEQKSEFEKLSPLFRNRSCLNGCTTTYICRNFVCEAPLNDASAIKL